MIDYDEVDKQLEKNKKAQAISFLRYNSSFLIMRYVNVNIIC